MLCEKCKMRNATTHIHTVVNGISREINLCDKCAAEHGYGGFSGNSLTEMLFSMLSEHTASQIEDLKRCPVCNSTFNDIAKNGKVGCAECYNTFKEELMPYVKRIHGASKHIGKVPNSAPLMVVPKEETVEDMRLQLTRLVNEEKYEEAAILRDKIKKAEADKNE